MFEILANAPIWEIWVGKKKKTLVLTLGRSNAYTANPPEKGGEKKKKKTLVSTLGSLPEKGEKDLWKQQNFLWHQVFLPVKCE